MPETVTLTPYATGAYDVSFGTFFSGNVDSITSLGGASEVEFFAFNISNLSTNQAYYSYPYAIADNLFYTPSTSDPFDTHTITIAEGLFSPEIAASIVSGQAGTDYNTYYQLTLFVTSVDVKASFGPAYPAVNNNVTQSANVASMLGSVAYDTGDVLMLFAYENSGGVSNVSNMFITAVQCFAAGTRILAERGEVAVEDLRAGDRVAAIAGGQRSSRPVVWIGQRGIDPQALPEPERAAPIRIRRHAIAENVPHRDLLVSPDHAIRVDGALVAARRLVNGATIVQEIECRSVRYFHIECDAHVLLLAEGLEAESYLAGDSHVVSWDAKPLEGLEAESYLAGDGTAFFPQPDTALALHPRAVDEARATPGGSASAMELLTDDAAVESIFRRLAARAGALGFALPTRRTTADPALRLVASGREIAPIHATPNRVVFALPRDAGPARLVSRAQAPNVLLPWLDDRRRLGVRVSRIVLHGADGPRDIPLDHPGLGRGWWDDETGEGARSRWTDGDAVLPDVSGADRLEIRLAANGPYTLAEPERPRARLYA